MKLGKIQIQRWWAKVCNIPILFSGHFFRAIDPVLLLQAKETCNFHGRFLGFYFWISIYLIHSAIYTTQSDQRLIQEINSVVTIIILKFFVSSKLSNLCQTAWNIQKLLWWHLSLKNDKFSKIISNIITYYIT